VTAKQLRAVIHRRTPLHQGFLRLLMHPGAYVSSGGTSEKISIVYGTVDTGQAGGVHGNATENEDILTVVLPAKAFIDPVRSGDINDLKTLVAGYWLAEHQAALKQV
jgi:hypothetical protein